ncbi:MAG: hypothetical protein ACRD2L_07660 [Terriglobia bacterium]
MNTKAVLLEFKINERVLNDDISTGLATASAAELENTYLLMPVRFAVQGQELLQLPVPSRIFLQGQDGKSEVHPTPASPWLQLPLLNVARTGRAKVELLQPGTVAVYSLPEGGNLIFKRAEDSVEVYSDLSGRTGVADYKQLVAAFVDFSSRVESFLSQHTQ